MQLDSSFKLNLSDDVPNANHREVGRVDTSLVDALGSNLEHSQPVLSRTSSHPPSGSDGIGTLLDKTNPSAEKQDRSQAVRATASEARAKTATAPSLPHATEGEDTLTFDARCIGLKITSRGERPRRVVGLPPEQGG
jgi:hypothetical protein